MAIIKSFLVNVLKAFHSFIHVNVLQWTVYLNLHLLLIQLVIYFAKEHFLISALSPFNLHFWSSNNEQHRRTLFSLWRNFNTLKSH